MNREVGLRGGIGLGATLMYLVDPDRGKTEAVVATPLPAPKLF